MALMTIAKKSYRRLEQQISDRSPTEIYDHMTTRLLVDRQARSDERLNNLGQFSHYLLCKGLKPWR